MRDVLRALAQARSHEVCAQSLGYGHNLDVLFVTRRLVSLRVNAKRAHCIGTHAGTQRRREEVLVRRHTCSLFVVKPEKGGGVVSGPKTKREEGSCSGSYSKTLLL